MAGTATIPKEHFRLVEAINLAEAINDGAVFDENGCVPIYIIRPGIGKGRGRHLYEAKMLEQNAHIFSGWKMYVDHESPEARKAAGGLPRKMRDLGGRIVESHWDPTVPADPERGHGQGAVVGMARPVKWIRELVEDDPELAEASICADATGVRPVIRDGQRVWCVEGIDERGSVDWVTEAGAGGRVAALLEAYAETEGDNEFEQLLEGASDEAIQTYLRENRPDFELAEASAGNENEGEPDMAEITKEQLTEALAEHPDALVGALAQSAEAQVFMTSLVEAKIEEEKDEIRAEAKAEADRSIQLRDMRDDAHAKIEEAKLPESWKAGLKARFALVEGKASAELDLVDEVDDDGEATKKAEDKLTEAVEAAIEQEQTKLREAAPPTRVRGQGAKKPDEKPKKKADGGDGGEEELEESAPKFGEGSNWRQLMESAGVDVDRAYALSE